MDQQNSEYRTFNITNNLVSSDKLEKKRESKTGEKVGGREGEMKR